MNHPTKYYSNALLLEGKEFYWKEILEQLEGMDKNSSSVPYFSPPLPPPTTSFRPKLPEVQGQPPPKHTKAKTLLGFVHVGFALSHIKCRVLLDFRYLTLLKRREQKSGETDQSKRVLLPAGLRCCRFPLE